MVGGSAGKNTNRKIIFYGEMKDEYSDDEYLDFSYDLLQEETDKGGDISIYRVNPSLARELMYKVTISPDVLNPRSEELERAYDLETYDRAIANPIANQEELFKLLLSTNKKTKKQPDKYIMQQPLGQQVLDESALMGGSMPAAGNSPLNAVMGSSPQGTTEKAIA